MGPFIAAAVGLAPPRGERYNARMDSVSLSSGGAVGRGAADTALCGVVEGGGCGDERREPRPCSEGEDSGETADTAARVEGGGCAVAGPGAGGLPWVFLFFGLLRRVRWGALALLLSGAALAMDGEVSDPLDGGSFPLLREAEVGAPWTGQGVYWGSYIRDPVVLVFGDQQTPLLEQVWTRDLGASVRLGRLMRVGMAWARHKGVASAYSAETKVPGDISVWTAVPVLEGDRPLRLAWYAGMDLPTGRADLYLGDPYGAVKTHLALSGPLGRLDGLANLGVRLAQPEELPGIAWGKRLEWGAGLAIPIYGPTGARVEVQGSAGLPYAGVRADLPVEALASVQTLLPGPFALTLGAGAGLSRGLGSPAWRLLVAVDARPRDERDTDADGVVDSRDRCVEDPEDLDQFEDQDGCPDPDNDQDRFPDGADACRDDAEVYNGLADDDGCPDTAVHLLITVSSTAPGGLERATLALGEGEAVPVLADEPYDALLPSGTTTVRATAEGHRARTLPVEVGDGPTQQLTVALTPLARGVLHLRLEEPGGQALAGEARIGAELRPVPAEGVAWDLPEGPLDLRLSAPGHRGRDARVEVPAEGQLDLVVELPPSGATLSGRLVETRAEIRFATDSDRLLDGAEAPLSDVLALLQENLDIELLRIEGHADEQADSRYNLDLSQRRADAVRAWLIARGVAPERLQAIGTGEARPATGQDASRRVEFLVLVWDDETREGKSREKR